MRALAVLLLLLAAPAAAQQAPPGLAPKVQHFGLLRVELQPMLFDQTRAFFQARGFTEAQADRVARRGCLFRASIGNAAAKTEAAELHLDLSRWRAVVGGEAHPLRLRDDWAGLWQAEGVPKTPRVAFRWALFPTEQSFSPDDYNWGMVTFGLAPGTRFDLDLRWTRDGVERQALFTNLECPDA